LFGCGADDCTASTSGTCLMDEYIMILIINPYYDFRSVQFMYVSDSSLFLFHPPVNPDMAVRYALKKSATYLYYKRIPYKFAPLS